MVKLNTIEQIKQTAFEEEMIYEPKVLDNNFATLWHSDLKPGRKRTRDSLKCLKFTRNLYLKVENKGIIRTDNVIEGKPSDFRITLIKNNLKCKK